MNYSSATKGYPQKLPYKLCHASQDRNYNKTPNTQYTVTPEKALCMCSAAATLHRLYSSHNKRNSARTMLQPLQETSIYTRYTAAPTRNTLLTLCCSYRERHYVRHTHKQLQGTLHTGQPEAIGRDSPHAIHFGLCKRYSARNIAQLM